MLKKSKRVIDIVKLHAILLFKTDFNASYKIIFNRRVIPTLEKKRIILYKIIRVKRS